MNLGNTVVVAFELLANLFQTLLVLEDFKLCLGSLDFLRALPPCGHLGLGRWAASLQASHQKLAAEHRAARGWPARQATRGWLQNTRLPEAGPKHARQLKKHKEVG